LSSEAETILEAARRTSDTLGLSGFYPVVVSWQEAEHAGSKAVKIVTPHFPVFEDTTLIISPILQGRVAAEDWGPILAPSFIFQRRLEKSYNIGALIRVLPALLLFVGFLVFSYLSLPRPSSELVVGVVVGAVVLIILGVYSGIQLGRGLVLKADREAALVIGSRSLIDVLRKLEVLREHDASRGNDWPEYGDHPSITKRIANLQNP
jgi:prepilin signal peptidase PulO-like enzyme (type II secretory pathway)